MTLAAATVLVVDDEPVLNLTLGLVLRQQGVTVLSAANGAEALELLETHAVDAMVCDQKMPVMDGPHLLRVLQERGRTVPTLLFVSDGEGEDVTALEAAGVRRFLTKPIQPAELLAAVEAVLAGS